MKTLTVHGCSSDPLVLSREFKPKISTETLILPRFFAKNNLALSSKTKLFLAPSKRDPKLKITFDDLDDDLMTYSLINKFFASLKKEMNDMI